MHWDRFGLNISPNGATGTHFSSILIIFWHFLDNYFCENQLFLKKSISRGSSGQSAKLKMITCWSSNSEVLTDCWPFSCTLTSDPCRFSENTLFNFKPYKISSWVHRVSLFKLLISFWVILKFKDGPSLNLRMAYPWIFWSKNWSRASGSALNSFLDALGSIWVKYQPKWSHGNPFQLNVDDFCHFFD